MLTWQVAGIFIGHCLANYLGTHDVRETGQLNRHTFTKNNSSMPFKFNDTSIFPHSASYKNNQSLVEINP